MSRIASLFLAWVCASHSLGGEGPVEKPYEGWPKIVKEMTGRKTTYGIFRITITPAPDQSGGGTGGGIWDVNVENMRTRKVLTLEAQSVGTRLLEKYNGYPQIEIWGNGGGGSYSRVLFRVEQGKYHAVRDDLFARQISLAKCKDVTAVRPGGEATLYYTGTMYPEASKP